MTHINGFLLVSLLAMAAGVFIPLAVSEEVVDGMAMDYSPKTYQIVDENDTVCMVIKLAANFSVPYENDTEESQVLFTLPVQNDTLSSSSRCPSHEGGTRNGWLNLAFGSTDGFAFQMNFTVEETGKGSVKWSVSMILFRVDYTDPAYFTQPSQGQNDTVEFSSRSVDITSSSTNGYKCTSSMTISLEGGALNATTMTYSDLSVDPFNTQSFTDCKADKNGADRIVPIAVGAALAALLLLVIVAYAINRRMTKRAGYDKV